MKKATRQDWQITAMPDTIEETILDRKLSDAEYRALTTGYIPKDMDDRWFLFVEDDWVNLHRSWTGNCIFQIKLESTPNGWILTKLKVNRNFDQYKSTNMESDTSELYSVLNYLIAANINQLNSL